MTTKKDILTRLEERASKLESSIAESQLKREEIQARLGRQQEAEDSLKENIGVGQTGKVGAFEEDYSNHIYVNKKTALQERQRELRENISSSKEKLSSIQRNFYIERRELEAVNGLLHADSNMKTSKETIIKLKAESEALEEEFAKRRLRVIEAVDKLADLKLERVNLVKEALEKEVESGVESAGVEKESRRLLDSIELQEKRIAAYEVAMERAGELSEKADNAYESSKKMYYSALGKAAELKFMLAMESLKPALIELRAAERVSRPERPLEIDLAINIEIISMAENKIRDEYTTWM